MKYASRMKTEFEIISKVFPQLKDWEIKLGQEHTKGTRYSYDCVFISQKKRKFAQIYPPSKPFPKDYILHEVMHIILRDIKKERNRSKSRDKEEHFIRAILGSKILRKYFPEVSKNSKKYLKPVNRK